MIISPDASHLGKLLASAYHRRQAALTTAAS